jgi:hypothetical protein
MKLKYGIIKILAMIALAVGLITACHSSGSSGDKGMQQDLMVAEKPVLDTSMLLGTLDLYRAKRYEGIREALDSGVENAHKLVLYGKKMGTLGPEIGNLTCLQTLDVAYNDLTELPAEISKLHYLQGFYANGNSLTTFPLQVLLLPALTSLDLSENQIGSIPPEIRRMDQLVRLSMDRNILTCIPVELYELENLSVLELAGNGLDNIPEGIANLTSLKKLDLSNNQLTTLPGEIASLTGHLVELSLQGNRIPREEVERLGKAMPSTNIRY